MTFEKVEHYLDRLEAVQMYDEVKAERDRLKAQLEEAATSHDDEVKELQARIDYLEGLRIRYGAEEYTIESFEKLLEKENQEWRKQKLKNILQSYWKKNRDRLIEKRLNKLMSSYPIDAPELLVRLIDDRTKKQVDETLGARARWPAWFKETYSREVANGISAGLDEEFNRRVEEKADERLRQKENEAWPAYVQTNVTPFLRQALADQLLSLTGTMTLRCTKCGQDTTTTITQKNVVDLIRKGSIRIICSNPNCRGPFNSRNTIRLTLGDLVLNRMGPQKRRILKIAKDEPEEEKTDP